MDTGVVDAEAVHAFCVPQKVDRKNPWVGLLARKVRIVSDESRTASPSPVYDRVARRSSAPSLTVAGPRRIFTGFPFMPSWAPKADSDASTLGDGVNGDVGHLAANQFSRRSRRRSSVSSLCQIRC